MTISKSDLATQSQRVLNVLIDMVSFLIIWFILSFLLIAFGFDQSYTDETGEQTPIIPLVLLLPTFWGYYLLSEYNYQQTIGKLLTKTKVVSITGEQPTLKQIIFRTLARSIPFEYFSFLADVVGIHDVISKTRVIKTQD
ncbi:MAG: RDD family protein [Saprospiraceae bacterium]